MKINENQWKSMQINETQRKSIMIIFYQDQWKSIQKSMKINENQCQSMKKWIRIIDYQWKSIKTNEN